jgi:hypothetical protein
MTDILEDVRIIQKIMTIDYHCYLTTAMMQEAMISSRVLAYWQLSNSHSIWSRVSLTSERVKSLKVMIDLFRLRVFFLASSAGPSNRSQRSAQLVQILCKKQKAGTSECVTA